MSQVQTKLDAFALQLFNSGFKIALSSYCDNLSILVFTGLDKHLIEIVFFKDHSILVRHIISSNADYMLEGENLLEQFALRELDIISIYIDSKDKINGDTDSFQDALYKVVGQ